MTQDRLNILENLLKTLQDGVTRQEFEDALEKLIKFREAFEKRTEDEFQAIKEALDQAIGKLEASNRANLSEKTKELSDHADQELSKIVFTIEALAAEAQAKIDAVRDGKDGRDGRDADESMVLEALMEKLGTLITPEMVKKLIIQAGLSIDEIQGAEDFVKKKTVYGPSVIHKFMDDETPSGTVNGVNDTFTLSKFPVNGSLKVYRGGARQRLTEDYTFSGRTIVFTIPPVVGEVLLCDYRYF